MRKFIDFVQDMDMVQIWGACILLGIIGGVIASIYSAIFVW